MINRREWLYRVGIVAGVAAQSARSFATGSAAPQKTEQRPLQLSEFAPKSMLQVHESYVERARFPAIDFHTHITGSAKSERGVALASDRKYLGGPEELLAVMDRKNLRAMVNLTGGYDQGLGEVIAKYDRAFPGRFYTFTEPSYARFKESGYPQLQAQEIEQA
ncbi:MAG TPA: amidohydrolase, partial [Acidobacteriota bacterium]|nr:amidohydrolase [Acidobacteriota bacterium]